METNPQDEQRRLITHSLEAIGDFHFALAGSGAIREHGLITRHTQDVDLFTISDAYDRYPEAISTLIEHLDSCGYHVTITRNNPGFTQFVATTPAGTDLQVDLGVDWRAHAPVRLEVGPVLSLEDTVGSKIAALYSRGYTRDYLDVDTIRSTNTFSDTKLIDLLKERDLGYEPELFSQCLRWATRLSAAETMNYGISETQLVEIQRRFVKWADSIDDQRHKISRGEQVISTHITKQAEEPTPTTTPPTTKTVKRQSTNSSLPAIEDAVRVRRMRDKTAIFQQQKREQTHNPAPPQARHPRRDDPPPRRGPSIH